MIELKNVSKSFDHGKTFAIKDLSLSIRDGETLVLLGSSGCGKTSTLKLMNRLIEPSQGEILVEGKNILEIDLIKLRRSIGYVFQGASLFPHLSIAENISIVLRLEKQSKQQQETRAHELLELVNLPAKDYANRLPKELSGGQQQRVGVARSLANKPKYLLMDEPFAALDAITRLELQDELLRLKKQLNITIIFVTHDLGEALKIADRIAVMNNGKIEQLGTCKEIVNSPKNDFVKKLFDTYRKQIQYYFDYTEHA